MKDISVIKHASNAPGLRLFGLGPSFKPMKGLAKLQILFNQKKGPYMLPIWAGPKLGLGLIRPKWAGAKMGPPGPNWPGPKWAWVQMDLVPNGQM